MVYETIDATNKALGRLSSHVATLLRGKHLPTFDPSRVPQVTVTVTNASHIKLTEKKLDQSTYYSHSGYPGGLRSRSMRELFDRDPAEIIRLSVRRMLPNNKLKRRLMSHLRITI